MQHPACEYQLSLARTRWELRACDSHRLLCDHLLLTLPQAFRA